MSILHKLIQAKKAEIERYTQLLKNQSAESEDRKDMIQRLAEREYNAKQELVELEKILVLVERYSGVDE